MEIKINLIKLGMRVPKVKYLRRVVAITCYSDKDIYLRSEIVQQSGQKYVIIEPKKRNPSIKILNLRKVLEDGKNSGKIIK